jgi:hypothetical protein
MKLFGNKKREPGYAGDPNNKVGPGGTNDRGLAKTKPGPAVSEESKQTAGALKGSSKSSTGILGKLFGSKKTDDTLAEPMSNVEYLGEIYKLSITCSLHILIFIGWIRKTHSGFHHGTLRLETNELGSLLCLFQMFFNCFMKSILK